MTYYLEKHVFSLLKSPGLAIFWRTDWRLINYKQSKVRNSTQSEVFPMLNRIAHRGPPDHDFEAFVAGALWHRLWRCVIGLVLFDSEGQQKKAAGPYMESISFVKLGIELVRSRLGYPRISAIGCFNLLVMHPFFGPCEDCEQGYFFPSKACHWRQCGTSACC